MKNFDKLNGLYGINLKSGKVNFYNEVYLISEKNSVYKFAASNEETKAAKIFTYGNSGEWWTYRSEEVVGFTYEEAVLNFNRKMQKTIKEKQNLINRYQKEIDKCIAMMK